MDDELPSVELTTKFLALCDLFGSERATVGAIALGRRSGVPGLPERADWASWNAGEMRAAVEYLEVRSSMRPDSPARRTLEKG